MELTESGLMTQFIDQRQALIRRWERYRDQRFHKRPTNFLVEMEDPYKKAVVAQLLENTYRHIHSLDEAMKAINLGSFEQWMFPMVRASFQEDIISTLASVQPMSGPHSNIFYYSIVRDSDKGEMAKGSRIFDATKGFQGGFHYSNEVIFREARFSVAGAVVTKAANLDGTYWPVRPGSVVIFDEGGQIIRDDGNGALVGDAAAPGTINYVTGQISVEFANAIAGTPRMNYKYDSEGNPLIPKVRLELQQQLVRADPRNLQVEYSHKTVADFRAQYGGDADAELVVSMSETVTAEIVRELIDYMLQNATAGNVIFNRNTGGNFAFKWHKEGLIGAIIQASNLVYEATQQIQPNFVVCGTGVLDVLRDIGAPRFIPDPAFGTKATAGPTAAGKIDGQWDVVVDPRMPEIGGGTNRNRFLVGYRGPGFLKAGLVFAPYVPFYTSPPLVQPYGVTQRGIWTEYAKLIVDTNFFATGEVVNV
jgi:hypothetical protein